MRAEIYKRWVQDPATQELLNKLQVIRTIHTETILASAFDRTNMAELNKRRGCIESIDLIVEKDLLEDLLVEEEEDADKIEN